MTPGAQPASMDPGGKVSPDGIPALARIFAPEVKPTARIPLDVHYRVSLSLREPSCASGQSCPLSPLCPWVPAILQSWPKRPGSDRPPAPLAPRRPVQRHRPSTPPACHQKQLRQPTPKRQTQRQQDSVSMPVLPGVRFRLQRPAEYAPPTGGTRHGRGGWLLCHVLSICHPGSWRPHSHRQRSGWIGT